MENTRIGDQNKNVLTYPNRSSSDAKYTKNNRHQWRKVLKTFDPIKNEAPIDKAKFRRNFMSKRKCARATFYRTKQSQRIALSPKLTSTEDNEINSFDVHCQESQINNESDCSLNGAFTNKIIGILNKGIKCDHELEINWSSSNESGNEENELNNKTVPPNCAKYLKTEDSAIHWSSSNESGNEENRLFDNSSYELDSFIKEIEKDIRSNKNIKQKLSSKKDGYLERFKSAISKSKTDAGFLEYEHRTGIISGLKGDIFGERTSYGSYLANAQIEGTSSCSLFLKKDFQSYHNRKAIICLLDKSRKYIINNENVYVQPNKVIIA